MGDDPIESQLVRGNIEVVDGSPAFAQSLRNKKKLEKLKQVKIDSVVIGSTLISISQINFKIQNCYFKHNLKLDFPKRPPKYILLGNLNLQRKALL